MSSSLVSSQVSFITINPNHAGQRLDNFLFAKIKGVPKSLFYRLLREGQIRVNKKRAKPDYRLQAGDILRLPPLRFTEKSAPQPTENLSQFLLSRILYEDEQLIVMNKPSKMAVHAGSNLEFGIIETLRAIKPEYADLALAHRLDRETSGCLLIAKNRLILNELQDLFRAHAIKKTYLALTKGRWKPQEYHVELPLSKNTMSAGERMVQVNNEGKMAITDFNPIKNFNLCTLVEVNLTTGRTHQIRVHAEYHGHPLAGDDKYGDREFNKAMHKFGVRRLFLHAAKLEFTVASLEKSFSFAAPLDDDLTKILENLEQA